MGELRALLSLYRVGIEEVEGVRNGKPYRGLVYTALEESGDKAPVTPLKASRLGEDASLEKIERSMTRAGEQIKTKNLHKQTLRRVEEALQEATGEGELRKRLKTRHIDLYLRRNDTGRITGVTFIDHETRCVLNGSRLGKAYSANALNERFAAPQSISGSFAQKAKRTDTPDKKSLRNKKGV